MNNYEERGFALLNAILTNRPKDLSGRIILFDDEDRKKYLDIIKAQKTEIEQNKTVPLEDRELLERLYGLMYEILIRKLI